MEGALRSFFTDYTSFNWYMCAITISLCMFLLVVICHPFLQVIIELHHITWPLDPQSSRRLQWRAYSMPFHCSSYVTYPYHYHLSQGNSAPFHSIITGSRIPGSLSLSQAAVCLDLLSYFLCVRGSERDQLVWIHVTNILSIMPLRSFHVLFLPSFQNHCSIFSNHTTSSVVFRYTYSLRFLFSYIHFPDYSRLTTLRSYIHAILILFNP